MNRTDYSRPSGFARWGWGWAALAFIGGLWNIVETIRHPHAWGVIVGAFTIAATIGCLVVWRMAVREDRRHRAVMARMQATLWGPR